MEVKNHWPSGYQEQFDNKYRLESITSALALVPDGGNCLEIGCGNGYWTAKLLVPKFDTVTAVDVISSPSHFKGTYYKQTGFDLKQFRDRNFDFVYSFGVFCHFTLEQQSAYLAEIRRVLTGTAIIMFANWPRQGKSGSTEAEDWYYCDLEMAGRLCREAGFTEFIDTDPKHRDTIALIK